MKRIMLVTLVTIIGFVFVINLAVLADESDKSTKIERVRWSGLQISGWRVFGSWALAPEEPSLFGAVSPCFRLNNDDKTVFRGLGRESGFAQKIFPTLHSRQNLRDILNSNDLSSRSLAKFDAQVASGEKINMVSTGLTAGGDIAMVAGVVMMFASLGKETEFGETPPMLKNGYVIASAGIAMWAIGKIGQLAGAIVTKQSFSHLGDAMRNYNKSPE